MQVSQKRLVGDPTLNNNFHLYASVLCVLKVRVFVTFTSEHPVLHKITWSHTEYTYCIVTLLTYNSLA